MSGPSWVLSTYHDKVPVALDRDRAQGSDVWALGVGWATATASATGKGTATGTQQDKQQQQEQQQQQQRNNNTRQNTSHKVVVIMTLKTSMRRTSNLRDSTRNNSRRDICHSVLNSGDPKKQHR